MFLEDIKYMYIHVECTTDLKMKEDNSANDTQIH